jgi:hypothetical protein
MAFLTYCATEEDKKQTEQTENKKLYQIKSGLSMLNSIIPKVLTPAEKQDPTTTCKYYKCFKSFGNINEVLKAEGKKKKDLKQTCKTCQACKCYI